MSGFARYPLRRKRETYTLHARSRSTSTGDPDCFLEPHLRASGLWRMKSFPVSFAGSSAPGQFSSETAENDAVFLERPMRDSCAEPLPSRMLEATLPRVVSMRKDLVILLIFFLGILLGVAGGSVMCVRYLRQEVAAEIGPRLRRLQAQLDNVEAAINLALVTRYADLSRHPVEGIAQPVPRTGDRGQSGGEACDSTTN